MSTGNGKKALFEGWYSARIDGKKSSMSGAMYEWNNAKVCSYAVFCGLFSKLGVTGLTRIYFDAAVPTSSRSTMMPSSAAADGVEGKRASQIFYVTGFVNCLITPLLADPQTIARRGFGISSPWASLRMRRRRRMRSCDRGHRCREA